MIACFHRLMLVVSMLLTSILLVNLCGCSRFSGFVMNESGQKFYQRGNYAMARHEFRKAVMDRPRNPNYIYNLAAASQKLGDFAAAECLYHQALSLNMAHQPSYHGLATLLLEQGRHDEAEHLLTTWAGAQPYLAEPHVELAWFQRTQGDVVSAEHSLQQALAINPRNARAMAQLGQVYEEQGRGHEALALYQRSLFVNGYQPQVRSRMIALRERMPRHSQGTTLASLPSYNAIYGNRGMHANLGYNPFPHDQYGFVDEQFGHAYPSEIGWPQHAAHVLPGQAGFTTQAFSGSPAFSGQMTGQMPYAEQSIPMTAGSWNSPGGSFPTSAALPQFSGMSNGFSPQGYVIPDHYGQSGFEAYGSASPQLASPQFGAPQYGTQSFGAPQFGSPQFGTPQFSPQPTYSAGPWQSVPNGWTPATNMPTHSMPPQYMPSPAMSQSFGQQPYVPHMSQALPAF